VVGATADVDEVIATDRMYASSVVLVVKLLKMTVNVKPSAMAAKSGMMAILFVWEAVRTPPTWRAHYRRKLVGSLPWGIPTVVVYRQTGAQATNLMVTQDTDKDFIQVRPPCGRNTYVLRLIVLDCIELR